MKKTAKVFDWQKAANVIRENHPETATAYLKKQRQTTGGVIWHNDRPVCNTYTFLQSDWDIPMLDCDSSSMECWRQIDSDIPDEFWKRYDGEKVYRAMGRWNMFSKWPESALKILGFKFEDSFVDPAYDHDVKEEE